MKPVIAKFLTSAANPAGFPREGPPEFGFLGRSNVGKSSLINSLLGQKLAHVSSTPGRTRTINFIGIYSKPNQPEPDLRLVDLPGYGYAKISREISAEWPKFIEPYLADRGSLRLCIVLIDANVPPQAPDQQLIEFLRHAGRDFLVVATKTDKLSGNKLRAALASLAREHGVETILPYSARTGAGRSELWRELRARTDQARMAQ
ncbi:MAG TPA: ribosome biogenesis GTP-binding protein YihA/YsxC [Candidatus Angelobacter sp.]|nr:ribosome biogenesis GTP-binding protein YihA/YsxC [Candidatus Angelobacter sp.]